MRKINFRFSPVFCLLLIVGGGAQQTEAQTKKYGDMTDAERIVFIQQQGARLSGEMTNGARPLVFGAEAARSVKPFVEMYAARVGTQTRREELGAVMTRARSGADVVITAYRNENLSPLLGLYTAFIESEYKECATSPYGAKGVFQIMPKTMQRFGGDPAQLCELKISAEVAARYHAKLLRDFNSSGTGLSLAVLSYNQGEGKVKAEVLPRLNAGREEGDLWALMTNPRGAKLNESIVQEGSKYVLTFYAAAIIGENPQAFGLGGEPLSASSAK